jgi:hypothetical protein
VTQRTTLPAEADAADAADAEEQDNVAS